MKILGDNGRFEKGHIPWNKGKSGKRPKGLIYVKHKENPTSFKKGNIPWNKGRMLKKIDEYSNGYDAIHEWVERWLGKPKKCSECSSLQFVEWSNISGQYKREKSDWQRLCKKCHYRYDFNKFNIRKEFYV